MEFLVHGRLQGRADGAYDGSKLAVQDGWGVLPHRPPMFRDV